MGRVDRRKYKIVIPKEYWVSTYDNIDWIYKEKSAKTVKRNKEL